MLKRNSDYVSDEYHIHDQLANLSNSNEEFLDLNKIISILRRRLKTIISCSVIIVCLAIIYLITATPKYTARALVLIDPREQKVLSSEAVISGLDASSPAVDSEVEIIRSRAIAERVIDKLKLGNEQKKGFLSLLKQSIFGASQSPQDDEAQAAISKEKRIGSFLRSLSVSRKGLTYVINVSFTSPDPEMSANVANAVGNAYLNEQLEAKFNLTRRASVWLEQKLDEMREKVRISERDVEVYKVQNNLVEADGKTLSEQQITQLNTQLIDSRAKTAGTFAKYKQAQAMIKRGGRLSSVADALQSDVIAALRKQLAEVGRKEAELKSRYGPKHPTVINIQAERRDIRKQISDEVSRIIANLRNEYEVSKAREKSLANALEELKKKNTVKNAAAIKLRELKRVADAEKAAFNALLNRFKETSAQETLQAADARIISLATPPLKPSSPKKTLILLMAGFMGVLFGVGLAFVREYFDSVFRAAAEVEQDLGIAHLASIPMIEAQSSLKQNRGRKFSNVNIFSLFSGKKSQKVLTDVDIISRFVIDNPLSHYSEAIRSLRMSTKLSYINDMPQVLMVTSALPNEGKTTTALNLAHYAALAGEKTLLMDADIRNPSLTAQYKPNASYGLLNILEGRVNFSDVCLQDEESGLHFLPNPNKVRLSQPSEILGSQPVASLIEDLRASYDFIIIDVAPLLPVVDAQVLLPHIDKAILVAEWGKTPKEAVKSSMKTFRNFTDKLLGVVLNKALQDQIKYYDRYGYGKYYGQYGYGEQG